MTKNPPADTRKVVTGMTKMTPSAKPSSRRWSPTA